MLTRFKHGLSTAKGFHSILGGYLAVVFLIRAGLFPGVTNDDAEQLLLSQAMAWGYGTRNPPMFTWFVVATQQITGVSVFATEAVKFALLFLTYALIYRSARIILRDNLLAALAALSLLAVYQFLWDAIINYSHTMLLAAASAAFLYAVLRLGERQDWSSYLLLGLTLGIGLLGKYSFIFFAVALLAAAIVDKDLRRCLLNGKALLSLALAFLIIAPHIAWLVENWYFRELSGPNIPEPVVLSLSLSLLSFVKQLAVFFGPVFLLLLLNFRRGFTLLSIGTSPLASPRNLLGITLAIMSIGIVLSLMLFNVLGFNLPVFKLRYMVIFATFPMFLFVCFDPGRMGAKQINRYVLTLAGLALLVPVLLLAAYVGDPRYRCKRCYLHVNYPAIAETLRQAGFKTGTILSLDQKFPLSGGLRPYFPGARMFSWKFPTFLAPPSRTAGQCLLIWSVTGDVRQDRQNEAFVRSDAKRRFRVDPEPLGPSRRIRQTLIMSDSRTVEFGYILAPKGAGDCR